MIAQILPFTLLIAALSLVASIAAPWLLALAGIAWALVALGLIQGAWQVATGRRQALSVRFKARR